MGLRFRASDLGLISGWRFWGQENRGVLEPQFWVFGSGVVGT